MRLGVHLDLHEVSAVLLDEQGQQDFFVEPIPGTVTAALTRLLRRVRRSNKIDHGDKAISALIFNIGPWIEAAIEGKLLPPKAFTAKSRQHPTLGLRPVLVLRIAEQGEGVCAPLRGWPTQLRDQVQGAVYVVKGGHDLFGAKLGDLDEAAVIAACKAGEAAGLKEVAVCAVGAATANTHEWQAVGLIGSATSKIRVTLSQELGGPGFLPRENATVLNASLRELGESLVDTCTQAAQQVQGDVYVGFVRSDGALSPAEDARAFPIRFLHARRAALLMGAAWLAEKTNTSVVHADSVDECWVGWVEDGLPHITRGALLAPDVSVSVPTPDVVWTSPSDVVAKPKLWLFAELQSDSVVVTQTVPAIAVDLLEAAVHRENHNTFVHQVEVARAIAVGTAIARLIVEVETLTLITDLRGLEQASKAITEQALSRVTGAGAHPDNVSVALTQATPLAYLIGVYLLRARAVGALEDGVLTSKDVVKPQEL